MCHIRKPIIWSITIFGIALVLLFTTTTANAQRFVVAEPVQVVAVPQVVTPAQMRAETRVARAEARTVAANARAEAWAAATPRVVVAPTVVVAPQRTTVVRPWFAPRPVIVVR